MRHSNRNPKFKESRCYCFRLGNLRNQHIKIDKNDYSFVPDNVLVNVSKSPKSRLVGDLIQKSIENNNDWKM